MIPGPSKTLIVLWLSGPLIWALHFSLLYAAQTLICTTAGATPVGLMMPVVVIATAAACAALAYIALRHRNVVQPNDQDGAKFLRGTTWMLAGLSLLAVLWSALPTLLMASCIPR